MVVVDSVEMVVFFELLFTCSGKGAPGIASSGRCSVLFIVGD